MINTFLPKAKVSDSAVVPGLRSKAGTFFAYNVNVVFPLKHLYPNDLIVLGIDADSKREQLANAFIPIDWQTGMSIDFNCEHVLNAPS